MDSKFFFFFLKRCEIFCTDRILEHYNEHHYKQQTGTDAPRGCNVVVCGMKGDVATESGLGSASLRATVMGPPEVE